MKVSKLLVHKIYLQKIYIKYNTFMYLYFHEQTFKYLLCGKSLFSCTKVINFKILILW